MSALLDTVPSWLLVSALIGWLVMCVALRRIRLPSPDRAEFRRGARLTRRIPRRAWFHVRQTGDLSTLSLGSVRIPALDETKHFKMIGTTGTGKSTAIRELLAAAIRRGDRAVISDPDGGFLQRLYRPGRADRLLNPFEASSERWDPFAEIETPYDLELLASALVPGSEDPSTREWRGYARTLLSAVMRGCRARGLTDLQTLWSLLMSAGSEELRPIVSQTPAQPFLEPDNARMLGSIRSVLLSSLTALEHVRAQRAASFSVRRWVREGRGLLFLPYQAGQIAALRGIIACWMRLAIVETMNLGAGRDHRLWFVVDELDALGAIEGLKDALARLRKFGGRCVIGFQSIAQVSGTYGTAEAQTIVENCGNTLILRCSSSEQGGTAQFASRLIGDREVRRRQVSRGRDGPQLWGGRGARRSVQISEQSGVEVAVLPSEIEQLPDLCGYLKLASSPGWCAVRLR